MDAMRIGPCPQVGEAKEKLISWQLEKYGKVTKQDAIAFVKTLAKETSATREKTNIRT